MSFSQSVREEICSQIPKAKHCQIAELATLLLLQAQFEEKNGQLVCSILAQDSLVKEKLQTLLEKITRIKTKKDCYSGAQTQQILTQLKMTPEDVNNTKNFTRYVERLLKLTCCKQAFLRVMFLVLGTMSDPQKSYHYEIAVKDEALAKLTERILLEFSLMAKMTKRKDYFVVYIKEAAHIVDVLGIMGAPISLMEMENIRILKEMRGNVNRVVNCEISNISRTINAAVRQLEDIEYIHNTVGLSALPKGLAEIAELRRQNPRISLVELGELLHPPIGKSGVNHRLRRICEFANHLRHKEDRT